MNPYKVLSLNKNATKQEIIQAVTLAMRERKHTSKDLAVAQKKLMDAVSNGAEKFVSFIDVTPFLDRLKVPETGDRSFSENSVSDADLTYLPISEKIA